MSLTCVGSTSCTKSKSTDTNLNKRDATRLLYHVQVFVSKTTITFYSYNMQHSAVCFYQIRQIKAKMDKIQLLQRIKAL